FCDWFGNQRKAVPFPYWYLEGRLHLQGFFLAREQPGDKFERAEVLTALLVTPRSPEQIAGYCLSNDGRVLQRFDADPDGTDVFLAISSSNPLRTSVPEIPLLPLPLENPTVTPLDLWIGICSWQQYQQHAAELSRLGTIRDAVRGSLRQVDIGTLLADFRRHDPGIRF